MGPNLVSVILYGSAAAGDFVLGISGHDILVVARQLGAADLAAVAGPLRDWERAGNPLPQLFTPEELLAAADVFPIELLDMQQSHRVLFGDDPLADLQIDMRHYRGQLEREWKVRLQLLRRQYIACAGSSDRVAHLMVTSISTFLVLLRAVLRLYDDAVPAEKADVLAPLARHLDFDAQPFADVLGLKSRKEPPIASEVENLFGRYLQSIEQVIHAVDRFLHPSPAADPTPSVQTLSGKPHE